MWFSAVTVKRTLNLCMQLHVLGMVHAMVPRTFCFPGQSCFPTTNDIFQFVKTMNGMVLFPKNPGYKDAIKNHNIQTTAFPACVVIVNDIQDIQNSVLFARKFNLKITIKSSGHDFNGRDTWDGSLMIHLGNYRNISFLSSSSISPMGEVTVGSGASWIAVYTLLNDYGRVIIGGSAHTVSMGGYTLGGGHSPICRMFGMAIDNLLKIKMITADGKIVEASENTTRIQNDDNTWTEISDGELFWSLRGGGGSTFGIVTDFTFKVHEKPESGMVKLMLIFPYFKKNRNIGKKVLQMFNSMLPYIPKEWGGYIMMNPLPNADNSTGSITFILNHFGGIHAKTRGFMDKLYNFMHSHQIYREYRPFKNFLEYEKSAVDANETSAYVFNSLITNISDNCIEELQNILFSFPMNNSLVNFTGTLIGGKMHSIKEDATAVHPGFRHAYISLTGALFWQKKNLHLSDKFITEGMKANKALREFGDGMYRNEASPLQQTWQDDYWGANYDRVLQSKNKWDPDGIFSCIDCVKSS